MEQQRQGKLEKWIHNFGKKIGSDGWTRGPNPKTISYWRTAQAAPTTHGRVAAGPVREKFQMSCELNSFQMT